MIKITKYIFYFVFCLLYMPLFAQVNQKHKRLYTKYLSLYPKNLTSHFPKPKKDNIFLLDLGAPGAAAVNSIYIGFYCEGKKLQKLTKELTSKNVAKYHFTDSCLLIVNYDSTIYEDAPYKLHKCDTSCTLLPIPNFENFASSPFPLEFYNEATLYVLGAEAGEFLDKKFLEQNFEYGNAQLSEKWEHGYTRGVLISNNMVVYWLEIW